ncbi:hypothetical protein EYF80_054787 [Liparis tanakae]|uniref:Uncharacterized protein n=1 Tax=Liparis tanakae TaxID=230148 RepID=A0A4Z2F1Y2_9TELE|nr:hypothetical protein EYF80_054787 [Liparis tanakae]
MSVYVTPRTATGWFTCPRRYGSPRTAAREPAEPSRGSLRVPCAYPQQRTDVNGQKAASVSIWLASVPYSPKRKADRNVQQTQTSLWKSLKQVSIWKTKQHPRLETRRVTGYRAHKENSTRTLDAGNASGGGRLLSRLLGLVGLEHSDGLVHLEQRITS